MKYLVVGLSMVTLCVLHILFWYAPQIMCKEKLTTVEAFADLAGLLCVVALLVIACQIALSRNR